MKNATSTFVLRVRDVMRIRVNQYNSTNYPNEPKMNSRLTESVSYTFIAYLFTFWSYIRLIFINEAENAVLSVTKIHNYSLKFEV
jgi:hypothetical protein